jgi:uncharacterized membrane protein YqjE
MDDRPSRESSGGILDSLRALLDTVLALLHNRAELVVTELEEETTRLVRVLLWGLAAVLTAIVGAVFAATMLLLAVPPNGRIFTAGLLAVLFLAFAGFGYLTIRKVLRAKPRPFDSSLRELEKDRDHLRSRR